MSGANENPMEQIANHALTKHSLPAPGSPWTDVRAFAWTFHAYKELGGFEPVAHAANRKARDIPACTLTDLRAALYFETRRYRHFCYPPDATDMVHIHALVEEIRARIRSGKNT